MAAQSLVCPPDRSLLVELACRVSCPVGSRGCVRHMPTPATSPAVRLGNSQRFGTCGHWRGWEMRAAFRCLSEQPDTVLSANWTRPGRRSLPPRAACGCFRLHSFRLSTVRISGLRASSHVSGAQTVTSGCSFHVGPNLRFSLGAHVLFLFLGFYFILFLFILNDCRGPCVRLVGRRFQLCIEEVVLSGELSRTWCHTSTLREEEAVSTCRGERGFTGLGSARPPGVLTGSPGGKDGGRRASSICCEMSFVDVVKSFSCYFVAGNTGG